MSTLPQSLPAWLERIQQQHVRPVDLSLARVSAVAERLAVTRPAPRVLTVAGTNGKGSTVVYAEALLEALGLRTGATLSPHVHRFNERVRVNGEPVSDEALCAAFEAIEEARGNVTLTYFEFATLAALLTIRRSEADVAVLEVGLGGRLDAVNLVSADVAVIASIGLDHQAFLGDDVETIGLEKAGILRPGCSAVLGPEVTESVRQRARELGCRVQALGDGLTLAETDAGWVLEARPAWGRVVRGSLAPTNCALAALAVEALVPKRRLEPRHFEEANGRARLPGRCELLRGGWQEGGAPLVVDVAHNPAAAAFLARQLQQRLPGGRFRVVLGMLEDKDAAGVAAALAPIATAFVCVPTCGDRGLDAQALAERIAAAVTLPVGTADGAGEALAAAGGDAMLACGSFAVVEAARGAVLGDQGAHPRERFRDAGAPSHAAAPGADRTAPSC